MSFAEGEMVGPYRIVEQLGQGGMATVLKAYHAALDRYVAIKVLHPAFLEDSSFQARFQREAKLVARLDHPNIVPIYDFAEHESRPYLVMKFIEGKTLKARLAEGPVERDQVLRVVQAVGAGLGYAHGRGILHRDVKPSNVLLADDGQIYLADFGLARIAQSAEASLTNDMIVGTPQYISPEQAMGKKDLDEGTDIYSFGVMLYELVVGRVPFSADTPFSIIHDHIYSPLPLPRQVNPGVSEAVERVLLKALSKDRGDRYKNVRQMVEAFERARQDDEQRGLEATAVEPAPADALAATAAGATLPAAAPAGPGVGAPAPGPAAAASASGEKRTRRVPWMWLSVLVVVILSCLVTFGALRSLRRSGATATQPGPARTPPAAQPQGSPLERAAIFATQNPDTPQAYLQLALAYSQAGEARLAQEAVSGLESLDGLEEALLWEAARQLAGQGSWLAAARLAVDAAGLHSATDARLPPDLSTFLHETVYKAAKDSLAGEYYPFDRLNPIDEPLARLGKARFTFFNRDPVEGQQLLDELLLFKPGFSEALLCQAEFSAKNGDVRRANQALSELRRISELPDWVIQEANFIEGTLP
jgi:serine/threonine-protein kinase